MSAGSSRRMELLSMECLPKRLRELLMKRQLFKVQAGLMQVLMQLVRLPISKRNQIFPVYNLVQAINTYLPKDIVVKSAEKVPEDFHSRYSAKSKTYCYTILNSEIRDAVGRDYCLHYSTPLNVDKMQRASKALMGKHDFSAFKSKSDVISSVRTIMKMEIKENGKYLTFTVEADGFLYKMVRSIVGTLLEVGKGKMKITEFKQIVKSGIRARAGNTVAASGLCLLEVKY